MRFVPVLIAGGGPVGMTLALALARLGVQSMLVERNPETTKHPKMDITNVRSMELFRRLGLVQSLRMTRGRCGSLHLHRGGLSPPTSCRRNRRLSESGTKRHCGSRRSAWQKSVVLRTKIRDRRS